ncbi:hypothetical protein [Streptomyces sp. NPDC003077]|uniref:hypothetical protein n=1 Tax=Streptomyces sp. NPDC003077 TaxID=3154443 RepID=UPI0033B3DC55
MYYRSGPGLAYGAELFDTATGTFTRAGQLSPPGSDLSTAITSKHVYWLVQEDHDSAPLAVRRADLDGANVVDLSPGNGPEALWADGLAASEDAVTVSARTAADPADPSPDKLRQFPTDGTRRQVSCNPGEQAGVATPGGRQVIWVDHTSGTPQLVTRPQTVERRQ